MIAPIDLLTLLIVCDCTKVIFPLEPLQDNTNLQISQVSANIHNHEQGVTERGHNIGDSKRIKKIVRPSLRSDRGMEV